MHSSRLLPRSILANTHSRLGWAAQVNSRKEVQIKYKSTRLVREDWEFKVSPYLLERGARRVGSVGTRFGSYVVMHTAEFGGDLMAGGVSIHPSHVSMMENHGEDAAEVYRHITSPQYFMATGETSDSLRPGGLAEEILETVRGGCI